MAEYLLGNIAIDAIAGLLVLAPLYGGGTLLIREVTRRAGRGWPTMILLGLAFAMFEEGLVTQSLFNPGYAGADLLSVTFVPALGIGVWWTLFVLTLHTVWSTNVPIALIESLVPEQGATPWLGNIGLAVAFILFVFGAVASFLGTYQQFPFLASSPQLTGAAVIVLALIAVAFAIPPTSRLRIDEPAPNPWVVGAVSFALSSVFMLATLFIDVLSGWGVVGIYLLLYAVAIFVILRWSRQAGWGTVHILALAGGALLTYAWHAFPQWPVLGSPGQVDLIGNVIFALGAVILLGVAFKRVEESSSREVGV